MTRGKLRLIVAISVGGVLVAIAMLLREQRKPVPATTCSEALLQLDDAITVWAELNKKHSLDVPLPAELGDQFRGGKAPACPEGGKLQLGTSSLATICSIHGHARDLRLSNKNKTARLVDGIKKLNPFRVRSTAPRGICLAYLRQIDGAKQQWALENKKRSEDVPVASDIAAYLKNRQLPYCSGWENSGGKYVIGAVSENPECTKTAHKL